MNTTLAILTGEAYQVPRNPSEGTPRRLRCALPTPVTLPEPEPESLLSFDHAEQYTFGLGVHDCGDSYPVDLEVKLLHEAAHVV